MKEFIIVILDIIAEFIDRNYQLMFNRRNCVRLIFGNDQHFGYNNVITNIAGQKLRCLGNRYFVILKPPTQ